MFDPSQIYHLNHSCAVETEKSFVFDSALPVCGAEIKILLITLEAQAVIHLRLI